MQEGGGGKQKSNMGVWEMGARDKGRGPAQGQLEQGDGNTELRFVLLDQVTAVQGAVEVQEAYAIHVAPREFSWYLHETN